MHIEGVTVRHTGDVIGDSACGPEAFWSVTALLPLFGKLIGSMVKVTEKLPHHPPGLVPLNVADEVPALQVSGEVTAVEVKVSQPFMESLGEAGDIVLFRWWYETGGGI